MQETINKETVDKIATLVELDKKYSQAFDRRLAVKAIEIASSMLVEDIPQCPVVLIGLYCKKYKDRFFKVMPIDRPYFLYKDMLDLAQREGMSDAYRGIEALFGTSLKWVRGGHMKFLMNSQLFSEHVVPNMRSRVSGEQAEWANYALSSREKGSREVRL